MTDKIIPVILGLSADKLTKSEKELLESNAIYGIILFSRNVVNKTQLTNLISEIKKASLNEKILISIDEEGGRVSRLRNIFPNLPSSKEISDLYKKSEDEGIILLKNTYTEIAERLNSLGIKICYAPVCDLSYAETHDVIGDRAFSSDVEIVVKLAKIAADTLLEHGIFPVIKHIPGHGLAKSDSHLELPIVKQKTSILAKKDFAIFKSLKAYPFAMTAHILYEDLDSQLPVTLSQTAISYIRNEIGYKNILISDDINMKALQGDMKSLTKNILAAGVDIVLHCNGNINEMLDIVKVAATSAKSFTF